MLKKKNYKMMTKEEFRKYRKKSMMGKNNPRWNGGTSEYPNHAELKRVRIDVLKKAKGKCEICGKTVELVHHIDGNKSNHNVNNLIAVCLKCHIKLHRENDFLPNLGRPSKYDLICGLTIKEISGIFGVCLGTVYNWIKNPKKEEWLNNKLKGIK